MLKFFGSAKALPSRKLPFHHSLIADRYSLPFFHLFEVLMTCAGMMLGRPIP